MTLATAVTVGINSLLPWDVKIIGGLAATVMGVLILVRMVRAFRA